MTNNEQDEHDPPDLVGMLAGELTRDETVAAAHHLEGCLSCARQLVDLAVAHAALRSSQRVDRLLTGPYEYREHAGIIEPVEPTDVTAPFGQPTSQVNEDAPLPPLAALSDSGRPGPAGRTARRVGPRRHVWRLAAAVAAVLLVAGVAVAVVASRHRSVGHAPVATAPLRPIQAPPGTSGSVAVFATGSVRSLTVATRHLPEPPQQSFYEVWLFDPATLKMLPMGVLSPSGHGEYSVSATIMNGYSAVDVSLQANNGNPAHSQTSVMRAYL